MVTIDWSSAVRDYTLGVDRGMMYISGEPPIKWSGISRVVNEEVVSKSVSHLDGHLLTQNVLSEDVKGQIQAFTYPSIFDREQGFLFNLSYRTLHEDHYKIHFLYNVVAKFSSRTFEFNEATDFLFDFMSAPITIPGAKPSSHIFVDSSKVDPVVLENLETTLYGNEVIDGTLPEPVELVDLFDNVHILRVRDNGDGTFTVTGPDEAFEFDEDGNFEITWPSVVYLDEDTYQISSL